MRSRFLLLITCAMYLCGIPLHAQPEAPSDSSGSGVMKLIAKERPDQITLRWGFAEYPIWKAAARTGIILERAELQGNPNRDTPLEWKRLSAVPIKPYSMEEWKSRFQQEDSLAGAAVQTLYGQSVVTSSDPFGSIVELHMQQQNLMGFALLLADLRADLATGLGMRFVDTDVQQGKGYFYRIFPAAPIPDIELDTVLVMAIARTTAPLPAIMSLRAEEGERQVVLRWDRFEHLERSYGGYIIEQSFDGGKNFTPRSDIPFMSVTRDGEAEQPVVEYSIHVERNYMPVVYRVRGTTAFGELSPPGVEITAMGRDKTAPKQPAIQPYEIVDDASVKLTWELRGDVDEDLDGFMIAKGMSPEGPFDLITDLLPKTERTYIDRNVNTMPAHYYVVAAVDTAGNSRMSAPILALFPDSIPPAIPTGLRASIDSSGVLQLSWTANTEEDLQGYRVFYANDPSHEFQQLTTKISRDTSFVDTLTLKTLSEEVYYKVTALDYNFNHSPFSEMLTAKKPDIVPPSAPLIHSVEVKDDAVEIAWHPSPTSDAASHVLVRRRTGTEGWVRLDSIGGREFRSYRDTAGGAFVRYEYAVYAYDDDGLRSPLSNVVVAQRGGRLSYDGVKEVIGRYDDEQGKVVVQWSWEGDDAISFQVYRSDGTNPARLYRSVNAEDRRFEEPTTSGTWKYAVKVLYPDGGESPLRYTGAIVVP
ncbi:MAG: hypothetical protein IH600_05525 [Bacteroidetes bacterium]|nr:hypothetical protein [Bacteroidota bacterium]